MSSRDQPPTVFRSETFTGEAQQRLLSILRKDLLRTGNRFRIEQSGWRIVVVFVRDGSEGIEREAALGAVAASVDDIVEEFLYRAPPSETYPEIRRDTIIELRSTEDEDLQLSEIEIAVNVSVREQENW